MVQTEFVVEGKLKVAGQVEPRQIRCVNNSELADLLSKKANRLAVKVMLVMKTVYSLFNHSREGDTDRVSGLILIS